MVRCGTCGTPAQTEGQRFCGHCGAALEGEADTPRERRLVSILFCDIVGFTQFSEHRDPEDVSDVLNQYFAGARRVIGAYGGTIEKFIGDAVMAVWGAPIAQEDDAERAVRAGLDMVAAIRGLADRLALPALRVRVGVLTGEAAVNPSSTTQGMVIGDAVNTASRIQSLAPPGEVYVDQVTRAATERSIGYEPGGEHQLKGKREMVRVWRAVRVVSLRGGGRRPGSVEPPLVGRDAELGRLKAAVDALTEPGGGTRLVLLTGDAGLGKSRLAWELQKYADGLATRVRWLAGRAPAFGEGVGFSPLAEMLRTAMEIAATDTADTERERIEGWAGELWPERSADRQQAQNALHRLLDLNAHDDEIDPGVLFSAWRSTLERAAARTPLVLCFEELHRAEPSLLQFIGNLVEWSSAPILILLLGRPDARFDPLAPPGERIELTPLGDEQMDALVASIVEDPPERLLTAVRADGGGVPLFAVEMLRALADADLLGVENARYVVRGAVGEVEIPPTIRALIASRLDRLGKLERRALAGGAILGERFATRGAAELAGIDPTDAATLLDGLITKAILRPYDRAEAPADTGFEFLQGVVRRVLVSSLARRERRRLHLAAITHLTNGPPGPDLAAHLANHLLAAEAADPQADDAPELRRKAGMNSERRPSVRSPSALWRRPCRQAGRRAHRGRVDARARPRAGGADRAPRGERPDRR